MIKKCIICQEVVTRGGIKKRKASWEKPRVPGTRDSWVSRVVPEAAQTQLH